ncbi:MAG: gliding motility protein GldN, partial [Bacteroidetes bacterium]|nr:gliding motility protein GldN [Bacteroidota bacterium]
FIVLVSVLSGVFTASAQTEYGDFTYEKKAIKERKIVPYPPLREADVMYAMRIHRVIDTREKINVIMKWPRNPLYRIIYESATTGYGSAPVTAYTNDSLIRFYTAEEVLTRGGEEEVIEVCPDPDYPDYCYDSTVINPFRPSDITRYKVMEDWVFDKQRSMFFVRIIAIAPLFNLMVAGQDLGEQELFWTKWDDFKKVIVSQEIFNRQNDAMRLNYLDFFEMRMFTSYVVKESNAFDNAIAEFEEFKTNPFDALLEAEKIKNKLFEWEHDLWSW